MKWLRWIPGKWHRMERRYDNFAPPGHPWAPIVTVCGKWMREADHESAEQPTTNVCARCAGIR